MQNVTARRKAESTTWYDAEPALTDIRRRFSDLDVGTRELSARLGLDRRTIQRLLRKTRPRADAADRIAIALGRHPCELWPNWFDTTPGSAS